MVNGTVVTKKIDKAISAARKVIRCKESIRSAFSAFSSYWGIDRFSLNNINVVSINTDIIELKKKLKENGVKINNGPCLYGGNTRNCPYLFLQIKDRNAGLELYTGIQKGKGSVYCRLVILSDNTTNVATVGVAGLIARTKRAIEYLNNAYGIRLKWDNAEIMSIELAFTFMYDGRIPYLPRYYFMHCLSKLKDIIDYKERNPTMPAAADITTIYSKTAGAKHPSVEYILYDKTYQLQRYGLLDDVDFKIYRFEIKLLKKKTIQDLMNHVALSERKRDDVITDHDIIDYIDRFLSKGWQSYLKLFMASVKNAKILLSQGIDYPYLIIQYQDEIMGGAKDYILDEEAFLYASPGGDNGCKKVWRMIEHCERAGTLPHKYPYNKNALSRMDGHMTEKLFNDAFDALEYARKHGLGQHPGSSSWASQMEHIDYGEYPDKTQYLKDLNKKSKPRLRELGLK